MSKHLTKRGEAVRVSLDPLTRARLAYAVHAIELLGGETNHSGIIRVAVQMYVRALGENLAKINEYPVDDPEALRLAGWEKFVIRNANAGSFSPWHDSDLERDLESATKVVGYAFPTFDELQKKRIDYNVSHTGSTGVYPWLDRLTEERDDEQPLYSLYSEPA